MCGIAGYLQPGGFAEDSACTVAMAMADRIAHRGPDDAGVWLDGAAGIALAHRRLAVLDLSPAGGQPMVSWCGRYVLVFNGEIYNHLALRKSLSAGGHDLPDAELPPSWPLPPAWRGHSDTETLLAAIAAWGVGGALRHCVGMFALALWDRQSETLTLARDRLGEKPLYYGWHGTTFLFGSELKALAVHPAFKPVVDRVSLSQLLLYTCIPGSNSIYEGISKLAPGSFATVSLSLTHVAVTEYWSLRDSVLGAKSNPFVGNTDEAIRELENRLDQAVAGQMIADVPVGVFLSGGVDSSTVAALMQRQSMRPIRTYSIGSESREYNEAHHAKEVARHVGSEHTEFYVGHKEVLEMVPRLPRIYDEPFADSSQIPTALISRLARQHTTVALTGDGGDELFGGYHRYVWAKRLWCKAEYVPWPVRRALGRLMLALPKRLMGGLMQVLTRLFALQRPSASIEDRVDRWAARLTDVRNLDDLYWSMLSTWPEAAAMVIGTRNDAITASRPHCPAHLADVERMMFLDTATYLPDDILVKVDRAAMASSLETRAPLLDHRVVEFAWRLPLDLKIRHGQGKWLLRQVLYRHVPEKLIDRPKMGFGVPLDDWLRGPLREWAESLLDGNRLNHEGFFQPELIRYTWMEHLSGKYNWASQLWSVLMFQAWLEEQS